MYGNREESVLDADVPTPSRAGSTQPGMDSLSKGERARLETATSQVRDAVDALVPDVAEVQGQVTETASGVGGLVVLQAPGLPPVGTTIEADPSLAADEPVLTETQVRSKATELVAQAVVVAQQKGPDISEMPAH
jgi:hypothetical protein